MAIDDASYARLHQRARRQGRGRSLFYALTVTLLRPLLRRLFRPEIIGLDYLPEHGPAIIAANHRSIYDFFFQGYASPRPLRWMAAAEMFERPLRGRLCLWLGAFPVRRGAGDHLALETARHLLASGQLVCIFPEGRTVRWGDPGDPHSGAARLAIECDVALVPMAMVGTEKLSPALWHRGHRVRIAFEEPILPPKQNAAAPEQLADEVIAGQVWPQVKQSINSLEHKRALALTAGGLVAAAVTITATALRRRRSH